MGWNVNFFMKFGIKGDQLSLYLDLVEKLNSKRDLFCLRKLILFDGSLVSRCKVHEYSVNDANIINVLREIKEKESTKDKYIYQSDFDVFREVRFSSPESIDHSDARLEKIRASLYFRQPNASWNPVNGREDLNIVWQVGDYKHYDQNIYQSRWEKNILIVMHEIKEIVKLGDIDELWGAGESFEGNPQEAFLTYIRNGEGWNDNVRSVPMNWTSCDFNVDIIDSGKLIYSKAFVNGSLGGLFQ